MSQLLPKRPTARLFIFDPDHRLLLIRYRTTPPVDPPYAHVKSVWFTPGGGVEPNESVREAAARELLEETGLTCPIGEEVAYREQDLTFFQKKVCVVERYFLVRTENSYVNTEFLADTEDDDVEDVRWFSMDELSAIKEHIDPPRLVSLAKRLAEGELPVDLVNLGQA
jgi:8-oxo-dGTP pyrophosphatase MutT (NUDIX family)